MLKYAFALTIAALGVSATYGTPCNEDNCLRAIQGSAFPSRHGSADCSSYFKTTVTPATSTVTKTLSFTSSTTINARQLTITTATLKTTTVNSATVTKPTTVVTTTSTTETDVETTILTDTVVSSITDSTTDTVTATAIETFTDSVTTTLINSPTVPVPVTVRGGIGDKRSQPRDINPPLPTGIEKRQKTVSPSKIPTYASACSGAVRYSIACSCVGVKKTTYTAPVPVITVTVSQTKIFTSYSTVSRISTSKTTTTVLSSTTTTKESTVLSTDIVTFSTTTILTSIIETTTSSTDVVTDTTTTTAATSTTTTATVSAGPYTPYRVRIENVADNSFVGYVSSDFNNFGERRRTQDVTTALVVGLSLPVGTTSATQQELVTLNSANNVDLDRLSYVVGFANTDNNLGAGSYNYAYTCNSVKSSPGVSVAGDNTFTRATGIAENIEASPWNVNVITGALTPVWVNDDGSMPTVYPVLFTPTTDNGILIVTGDTAAFASAFQTTDFIQIRFILELLV